MNGNFTGFEIRMGPGVPKAKITKHLSSFALKSTKAKSKTAAITTNLVGNYIAGKIIALKGEKTSQLAHTTTFQQASQSVPEHYELSSSNYFVINIDTYCGLYLRYNGGKPFGDFAEWIERECRSQTKIALDQAIAKAGGKKAVKGDERTRIDTEFQTGCYPLIRRENLDQILLQWKRWDSFRYIVTSRAASESANGPLSPYTNREQRILKLSATSDESATANVRRDVVSAIREMRTWVRERYGKSANPGITGVNAYGHQKTVNLDDLVDNFGTIDLDDVLNESEYKCTKLERSAVINMLIQTANDLPEYFCKVAK